MKAEQRKELETNTLADKMGQMVQRVKTSPRRTFVTYTLIAVAVVVAAYLGWKWYIGDPSERSLQWIRFYDGAGGQINDLANKDKDTAAGKAARFQIAWFYYWESGIKDMATNKAGAMIQLQKAADFYGELAKETKEDPNPLFHLQALLGRAVATESMAVENRAHLDKAAEYYEEVLKHEKVNQDKDKYAEAKFAQQRLDILKDKSKRSDLSASYKLIQDILGVPDPPPPELKGILGGRKQ